MNAQVLISYSPFLALLYAAFALIQALRHKRQGVIAIALALAAVGAPLAAYILNSDLLIRASLVQAMTLNAIAVFVASLLVLLIERGRLRQDSSHSYGMLGLGLSLVLAIAMFALPMLATGDAAAPNFPAAAAMSASTDTTVADAAGVAPGLYLVSQEAGSTIENSVFASLADPSAEATDEAQPAAEDQNIPVVESAAPEVTPTTVIRPTRIAFDTVTPTPEIPQAATEIALAEPASATCTLITDYNLNLRDQPSTDGSTIYLSIPYGTTVETTGHTEDGWYAVTYEGYTGWVSGEYATPGLGCDALPVVEAS